MRPLQLPASFLKAARLPTSPSPFSHPGLSTRNPFSGPYLVAKYLKRTSANMAPHPVERVSDNFEKPDLDDRLYRVIRLKNKLEALLVHDPDTDKARASVSVDAGSFSDADDMPGMAHAVEHLLFMGTKKVNAQNVAIDRLLNSYYSIQRRTSTTNTSPRTLATQMPTRLLLKPITFLRSLPKRGRMGRASPTVMALLPCTGHSIVSPNSL